MLNSDLWLGRRGAVSLSFDDGTDNQLRNAAPPMTKRGICGTFYVHARDSLIKNRLKHWQEVAAAGHEIGNHSLNHLCANNFTEKRGSLEDVSIGAIEADMLEARERLMKIAPDQAGWTFAYPCACLYVGAGENRQSYVPLVAKHFLAGRGQGEYGFGNHPDFIDTACVWGLRTERMSGFEMIGLVEELTFRGLWVILIFHDIDGGVLSVPLNDFELLLDYLKRREDEIWTAPIAEVAARVVAHQESLA